MISVSINNEEREVDPGICVRDTLLELGFNLDKVAIAVNMEFLPRSEYTTYLLKAGDKVDVLAPVQGG